MFRVFDRAFLAMGVDRSQLCAYRNRKVIYAGLMMMGTTSVLLVAGIINNVV